MRQVLFICVIGLLAQSSIDFCEASLTSCFGCLLSGSNPAKKLNEFLEAEVRQDADNLLLNVETAKELIKKKESGSSNEQLVEFAKKFVALEQITTENICEDESADIVSELSTSLRHHYQGLPLKKIGNRIARGIAALTTVMLQNCIDRFEKDWNTAVPEADEELGKDMDTRNAFLLLKDHSARYDCGLVHLGFATNYYADCLIAKSDRDLGATSNDRIAFRDAMIDIAKTNPSIPRLSDLYADESGKLKFPDAETVEECFEVTEVEQACDRLINHPHVKLAEKLLKIVRAGSLGVTKIPKPTGATIEDSKLISWTANLSICKRLMVTDKRKLFEYVANSTK